MGYDIQEIRMSVRLERHNGPGDVRDDAAIERWGHEVRAMIDADPDYRRIFSAENRYYPIEVPA